MDEALFNQILTAYTLFQLLLIPCVTHAFFKIPDGGGRHLGFQ